MIELITANRESENDMCYAQYLEDLDYSISAQFDRFDGYDRGDTGPDQEYIPTEEEEAEMVAAAAHHANFVGPVQPYAPAINGLDDDIPF